MRTAQQKQRGAALIIVLLLAASLSFLVLALVGTMSLSIRRTSGTALRGELLWRAVSVETIAIEAISTALNVPEGPPLSLEHPLFSQQFVIPFETGAGAVIFADATRCFNVNSLATSEQDEPLATNNNDENDDEEITATVELVAILTALEFGPTDAENIANAIKDFVDTDDVQEIGGAEDGFYTALPSPYRTAGGLIASVSELRTVKGINPETYAQLSPHLCTVPSRDGMNVNVNTLRPEQAIILSGLTGGTLSVAEARTIITDRPPGGWQSIDEFTQLRQFQNENINLSVLNTRTAISSDYIEARAGTTVNEIDMNVRLIFSVGAQNGEIGVINRVLGNGI